MRVTLSLYRALLSVFAVVDIKVVSGITLAVLALLAASRLASPASVQIDSSRRACLRSTRT
jgi:hypothetical protein